MPKTSFDDLPEWIQTGILETLEFDVLLKVRVVCRRWNACIKELLAPHAILNIRHDSSAASKQFRRGKWQGSLIIPCQEIRILPKPINAFIYGKAKRRHKCSLKHFGNVKKFTLFENGSFLHFIHRYMPLLPKVKYIQIKELQSYEKVKDESKYTYLGHVYTCAIRHMKTWYKSQENLAQVETLRIRLFDRLATIVYIQAFTFRTCALINVELDFSKLYGHPFQRFSMNELNGAVCDLLEHCYLTLKQLRIKWAVRTDTDIDYARSEENIEPFFEFLLSLRNPVWKKLKLDFLFLTFPTVNLALNLSETFLYPLMEKLVTRANRINLSRVLPNAGMESFLRAMPPNTLHKFEFTFFFADADLHAQQVPLIRGVEVLLMSGLPVDETFVASLSRLGLSGSRHYHSLKFITGHNNFSYSKPNVFALTEYFPNLKNVELLDSSMYAKTHNQFTTDDFNLLVMRLPRLTCLRMSNAKLEDAPLSNVPERDMNRLKETGVFHYPNHKGAAVASAKELRFLDLRDLPSTLTDFSVYFAFQHIRKLEKISFHGKHFITDWGKGILERRKNKNPSFAVIFRSMNDDDFLIGNYSCPSSDFP